MFTTTLFSSRGRALAVRLADNTRSVTNHTRSAMNSGCPSRKESAAKPLVRATSLPAELTRYSKNCKLLCNILRDTKIVINEINTVSRSTQVIQGCITFPRYASSFQLTSFLWIEDEAPSFQICPDELHVVNDLVDRSISLVVLGHSNIARAILTNELVGGKAFFPVVSET